MRHDHLNNPGSFDFVEISTLQGPASEAIAQLDFRRPGQPEAAVPDVPHAVGLMLVGIYVAIVGLFALTLANAGQAPFMIAIDGAFLAAFFAVPSIMLKLERDRARRPSMSRFLSQGMQTYTGHVSGAGALVQMFIVPVLLAFAVLAIGIIAAVA